MNLESFFDEEESTQYNTEIDVETRKRIKVSVYAYLYEYAGISVISDSEYDQLALTIDLSINTRRPDLDKWFRDNFSPYTGMWIRKHPERQRIAEIANKYFV